MTNLNVKTCKKKKEQTTMATTKVAQPNQKPQKTSSYACHIYGLNGHKMADCLKFIELKKMFHGKLVIVAKVQHVAQIQIIITNVNVVDVNVTIISKAIEEQMFKEKEPSICTNEWLIFGQKNSTQSPCYNV